MLEVKKILPSHGLTDKHIFDLAEEGKVERAIIDDNIELLQQLLTARPDEENSKCLILNTFYQKILISKTTEQIELKLQHYLDQSNVSSI